MIDVFPEPISPIMATNSPRAISSSTPLRVILSEMVCLVASSSSSSSELSLSSLTSASEDELSEDWLIFLVSIDKLNSEGMQLTLTG